MAKLPRIKQEIFGSEAGPQDIGVVGSLHEGNPTYALTTEQIQSLEAFKRGLRSVVIGENSPILEEDNGMYKLITQQLAYLLQRGIPEWNEDTVYYRGSWVSDNSGNIYFCLFDNVSTPPSVEDDWVKFSIHPNQWPNNFVPNSKISLNMVRSEFCESFSTSSVSPPQVIPELEVTIVTSGKPVIVCLVGESSLPSRVSIGTTGSFDEVVGLLYFTSESDGSPLETKASYEISAVGQPSSSVNKLGNSVPSSSFFIIDDVPAGTYTYKVSMSVPGPSTGIISLSNSYLVAREM